MKQDMKAGWAYGAALVRKACYFPASSDRSLCNKIMFYFGPREEGNDDSPDNCAACKKKLAATKPKGH